ncbi:MAG: hypothetical protein IPI43_14270 [Sandaracinaceae bacterium]|nr:hypothetical protein [Sandaracinaceae bacterium]
MVGTSGLQEAEAPATRKGPRSSVWRTTRTSSSVVHGFFTVVKQPCVLAQFIQ